MNRILLTAVALVFVVQSAFAEDGLPGNWVNTDKKTRGLTRLTITKDGKFWSIQTWGAVGGGTGENPQGMVILHILGDSVQDAAAKYGFASWDHKFKETHLTIRLEQGQLIAEEFNLFKDNSGRSNYRSRYDFKKAE